VQLRTAVTTPFSGGGQQTDEQPPTTLTNGGADINDHHGYEHHSTMIGRPSRPVMLCSADRNN